MTMEKQTTLKELGFVQITNNTHKTLKTHKLLATHKSLGTPKTKFKKIVLLTISLIIILTITNTTNSLLITQVYYDPFDESNSEVIELYNEENTSINLFDYKITSSSKVSNTITLPGIILKPNQYFLIADSGFSESKDDSNWPNADYEQNFNLNNADAGLILLKNDQVIDAVGWGSPENETFYFGIPTAIVPEGKSISRIYNTTYSNLKINSLDFYETIPNFKNSNYSMAKTQTKKEEFEVQVLNVEPIINSITISQDNEEGIYPNPGRNKTINITANITDYNTIEDITSVEALFEGQTRKLELTENKNIFQGTIEIPFYYEPKKYDLTIIAEDNESSTNKTIQINYLSMSAVSISSVSGDLKPGFNSTINLTLKNAGNVKTDFKAELIQIEKEENNISIKEFSLFYQQQKFSEGEIIPFNLEVNTEKQLQIRLLTGEAPKGKYNAKIELTAIGS